MKVGPFRGIAPRWWVLALTAAALTATQGPAAAQADYPNKPIVFINPGPPGGVADQIGRLVADQLTRRLGQPVVVENRAGASGNIATQAVATAKSDGYTILLGNDGPLVISPNISSKMPFDSVRDFAPVGKISDTPMIVVIRAEAPAKTMGELISLSKNTPGGLAYGTPGAGSTQHLMFELINQRTGSKFVHVPYKGAVPAMVDVLGGHIPVAGVALAGSFDLIKSGRLRAIAISSAQRSKFLPEVPTLAEGTSEDLIITTWHGILVPAKTPRAIVDKLNLHLNAALADPDVRARLEVLGSVPAPGTPEDFGEQIRRDLVRFAEVIKRAKIAVE